MAKIIPHLWYDTQAVQAAELYTSTFPDSKIAHTTVLRNTPSGDCDLVSFELFGQPFMAISAGPLFTFNPSVSFLVSCETADQVDDYWARLSDGGTVMMPLDEYPFSKRFGWTQDRYGLSWQLMLSEQMRSRITPMLMFVGDVCGKTEEAIAFYTSVFPDSNVNLLQRYGQGQEPEDPNAVQFGSFALAEQGFAAMDSAREHNFNFNEAISFLVSCDSQQEIDRYWEKLSAVPEAEQCGWLKDRYGLSWQVSPSVLHGMLADGSDEQIARVTQAFLKMKKFDLTAIERAYRGS